MNRLTPVELERDVSRALSAMSEFFESESWLCNYPYGSYSDSVIEYVRTKGAVMGFSTDVGPVTAASDPMKLPRFDCNDFPPKSENYLSFEG